MEAETEMATVANFEFVEGKGIHPFYLEMEVDQVLEAAVGWEIKMVERDSKGASINVHFQIRDKIIEVDLMNTLFAEPGSKSHYRVYYIVTDDLQFSDGVRASEMKKENLISRFKGENALVKDNEINDDEEDGSLAFYKSINEEIFLMTNKYEKPRLGISRTPEPGQGEND